MILLIVIKNNLFRVAWWPEGLRHWPCNHNIPWSSPASLSFSLSLLISCQLSTVSSLIHGGREKKAMKFFLTHLQNTHFFKQINKYLSEVRMLKKYIFNIREISYAWLSVINACATSLENFAMAVHCRHSSETKMTGCRTLKCQCSDHRVW